MLPPQHISRVDAQNMLMSAIERGVPLFNHGDPAATAALYAKTMKIILDSPELSQKERVSLERGLSDSDAMSDMQAKAWRLRYAIDDVMQSLQYSRQLSTRLP